MSDPVSEISRGFSFITLAAFDPKRTNVASNTGGDECIVMGSGTPLSHRGGPQGSPFFWIPFPLTQNDQIRRGNTYGQGAWF